MLEAFFCLGCHPDQPAYVNDQTFEVRVCPAFADALHGTGSDKGTLYDACGLNIPSGCSGEL